MGTKKSINEDKFNEYKNIRGVIREVAVDNNISNVCLNNHTLKTLAGYTEESTEENFNEYVKSYIDKLSYDSHRLRVEDAQEQQNAEALKKLTTEVMDMAGYIKDGKYAQNNVVNQFAKSFVDRIFFEKEMDSLYKAIDENSKDDINEAYRRIYERTNYSETKPYGVVNDYAQSFVDGRINTFIRKKIHQPEIEAQNIDIAI